MIYILQVKCGMLGYDEVIKAVEAKNALEARKLVSKEVFDKTERCIVRSWRIVGKQKQLLK